MQEELKERHAKAKADAEAKAKALEKQRTLPKVDNAYTFKGRAASEKSEKAGSVGKATGRQNSLVQKKKGAEARSPPVPRAASMKKPTVVPKKSPSPAKGVGAKLTSPGAA